VKKELEDFGDFPRARLEKRLPVVLSHQEVQEVLRRMDGVEAILARPRTRPEITDRFPISSSGHLGPLLNREILNVAGLRLRFRSIDRIPI